MSTRDHSRDMQALRDPDPDLPGFQLPPYDAPREDWVRAFAELNAVPMTLDQIVRGYSAACPAQSGGVFDIRLLRAFCEAEGLLPADVAAEAIIVRWEPVLEAGFEGGIEIFEGDPPYAAMALRELRAEHEAIQFLA